MALLTFRVALALTAGWIAYLVFAILDICVPVGGCDGMLGILIQAVMGAVFTVIAVMAGLVIGLPFYVWPIRLLTWFRVVLCAMLAIAGVFTLMAARLPANQVTVPHPELGSAGVTLQVGNPQMGIVGWGAMIFGILHAGGGTRRPPSLPVARAMIVDGSEPGSDARSDPDRTLG